MRIRRQIEPHWPPLGARQRDQLDRIKADGTQMVASVTAGLSEISCVGGLEGKKEPYYVTTQSPIGIQ